MKVSDRTLSMVVAAESDLGIGLYTGRYDGVNRELLFVDHGACMWQL